VERHYAGTYSSEDESEAIALLVLATDGINEELALRTAIRNVSEGFLSVW
jgi:hypothetical protein